MNELPVDPDLIAAREIAACAHNTVPDDAAYYRSGRDDRSGYMRALLAAIKRGRELEREAVHRVETA